MARYTIFKQGDVQWLWDDKTKKLYEQTDDGVVERPGNPNMLEKFCPLLEIIEETDKLPKGWVFDERQTRAKKSLR